MVCDFLGTATLSFHLFCSCKRMHISATPMNIAVWVKSGSSGVLYWKSPAVLEYSVLFHISLFKETFGGTLCVDGVKHGIFYFNFFLGRRGVAVINSILKKMYLLKYWSQNLYSPENVCSEGSSWVSKAFYFTKIYCIDQQSVSSSHLLVCLV